MSFTTEISEELVRLPLKKNCCRRALLFGLLMGATETEDGRLTARYYSEETAALAEQLLTQLFRAESERRERVLAARRFYEVTARVAACQKFLRELDQNGDVMIHAAAGFRCAACQGDFLRGVFLGCATVTDPNKGYHMEISLPTEGRCDALRVYLEARLSRAGKVKRGKRFGLYYKSNGAISDFLYYIGGSGASFGLANVWIKRDIRNNVNRGINCEARNISRSVDASMRQREAIERLGENGKLSSLPEELQITARLRMEYPDASLAELSLLHEPPISKSGLNRRLTRLLEEAEEA